MGLSMNRDGHFIEKRFVVRLSVNAYRKAIRELEGEIWKDPHPLVQHVLKARVLCEFGRRFFADVSEGRLVVLKFALGLHRLKCGVILLVCAWSNLERDRIHAWYP